MRIQKAIDKETCSYVWWPQGELVAPLAPVPGFGQRKQCQHIAICPCINVSIAFWILVLSVSFIHIVPSFVQCYFAHWLTILLIAPPIMSLQRGVMFHLVNKLEENCNLCINKCYLGSLFKYGIINVLLA